ncbi:unnamed protein product [Vitrella brassicaformis CCMP3155]|uniref:Integrase catalytic domain-containing protein n=1 Tax=Vitrella brassicaformis (strain CCMP3155) TaxID=1169540 RepID=A0A0G4GQX8_VITBC|nr:unnamed protein product [Vitrella brassicaformis CCMP3155]|eukprot:CEM32857.1 unnamed protein product [Vitrella brassicaformis CCMP3155]
MRRIGMVDCDFCHKTHWGGWRYCDDRINKLRNGDSRALMGNRGNGGTAQPVTVEQHHIDRDSWCLITQRVITVQPIVSELYSIDLQSSMLVDCAATNSAVRDGKHLVNISPLAVPEIIRTASNDLMPIKAVGTLPLTMQSTSGPVTLTIGNIAVVLDLKYNVFATDDINLHGYGVYLSHQVASHFIHESTGVSIPLSRVDQCVLAVDSSEQNYNYWHNKSHATAKALSRMSEWPENENVKVPNDLPPCDSCKLGAMREVPKEGEPIKADFIGDLVTADIKPVKTSIIGNLISSSSAPNTDGHGIHRLRTDNGGEFHSRLFCSTCADLNIKQEFSAAHHQHQNGIVERSIGIIVDMSRKLLHQSGLWTFRDLLWPYAVKWATYLRNRMPHAALSRERLMTPIEALRGVKPDYKDIHAFGALAYVHQRKAPEGPRRHPFDFKAEKGVYLGRKENTKDVHCVFIPDRSVVVESRDVSVHESVFPLKTASKTTTPATPFPATPAVPTPPQPRPAPYPPHGYFAHPHPTAPPLIQQGVPPPQPPAPAPQPPAPAAPLPTAAVSENDGSEGEQPQQH